MSFLKGIGNAAWDDSVKKDYVKKEKLLEKNGLVNIKSKVKLKHSKKNPPRYILMICLKIMTIF